EIAPDWPYGAPAERLAAQAGGLRADYRRTVSDFLELQVRASADGGEALKQMRAALFAHGSAAASPHPSGETGEPGPSTTCDDGSHGSLDNPSGLQALNIAALARG